MINKLNEPVFIKDDSSAQKELEYLKILPQTPEIQQYVKCIEAGIFGENQIKYELSNSHIPMYVLHDVFLEHNGLTAQIDFLVLCRKHFYVIECKNLFGNIEINEKGDFIRTLGSRKEGIYSPITQNQRHLDLITAIRKDNSGKLMKGFISDSGWKTIVVLANPKTILDDKNAPKEIKEQIIRADQLVAFIKKSESESKEFSLNDKELKDIAEKWLSRCKENPVDYATKYSEKPTPTCPKCGIPMVKRVAKKGDNIGEEFWGCPNFPRCRQVKEILKVEDHND